MAEAGVHVKPEKMAEYRAMTYVHGTNPAPSTTR